MTKVNPQFVLPLTLLIVLAGGGLLYAATAKQVERVRVETASSTSALNIRIDTLEGALQLSESKNIDLATALQEEQDRRNSVERQIKKISNTVDDLEKLSETDKELLQKYSKVSFLNEHYIPSDLTKIDSKYTLDQSKTYQFHEKAWPYLEDLLRAAARAKIDLKIDSAYRSFGTQAGLKSNYLVTYGTGANQFSADQGFSEHQLGTTLDFSTAGIGASLAGFENTPTYKWLQSNAHKYGFTLSYPPGNAYYQFEPWHWRFVGVDLATKLFREKRFFYDLEQRDIDKYLLDIFE